MFLTVKRPVAVAAIAVTMYLFAGCGSSSTMQQASSTAPTILVQPIDQSAPLGGSVTFSVVASGSGPLAYQWSDNGNPISGATSASVTVSTLSISNSGDKFVVTVTNSAGSAKSNTASLTLGPRTPDPHDLRFQHVGFPQLSGGYASNIIAVTQGNSSSSYYTNSVGSGLTVGPMGTCAGTYPSSSNCSWSYYSAAAVGTSSFTSYYEANQLANLQNELQKAANTPNAIITTLDEVPQYGLLAVSVEQDPSVSSGFVQEVDSVLPSGLNSLAQQLAAKGFIITGVSGNANGGLDVISYSYSGAGTTTYDVSTVVASSANIGPAAAGLAASGFILTAVGQNGNDSFIAIGTRVKGDSLARPFAYTTDTTKVGSVGTSAVRVGSIFGASGAVNLLEQ